MVDLSPGQRLALGVTVLALVDILWVTSSELTEYIFKVDGYNKPFFSTYLKNAMFSLFLLGFLVWPPWRSACAERQELLVPMETMSEDGASSAGSPAPNSPTPGFRRALSEPEFVPVMFDEERSSGTDSEDQAAAAGGRRRRAVRFSRVKEVRQLCERDAGQALFARLSYRASVQLRRQALLRAARLPPGQVARLALQFTVPFVLGQYCYQLALSLSEAAYVNILSSSSGLFALVLAAVFPSTPGDRFTLSKLLAITVNIGGVVAVSLSGLQGHFELPLGALWALAGAFLYASYVVLLRARVDHEDKLDLIMFFGFVGAFTALLFWPGFLAGHYSGYEPFQLPSRQQWMFLVANGLIGTVLSELLWMWGCLLTSTLIATLSLSATIPLTMAADVVLRSVHYPASFYLGSVPIFAASVAVTLLAHWDNWDPALEGLRLAAGCCCRCRRRPVPLRSDPATAEQSTSLISASDDEDDEEEEFIRTST
ncbi:solute carrier family 35 member F5-like [Amphibalanus amphitrite]|uniref:solute carrier family 35 member F5-like n=1 Tax=Amphibalanus amphitrite TaxID=1232801 RepID=UPI001C90A3CC|nr:solute carrier family 35 member F5-like [Amphibalanus amphitrite]